MQAAPLLAYAYARTGILLVLLKADLGSLEALSDTPAAGGVLAVLGAIHFVDLNFVLDFWASTSRSSSHR